MDWIVIAALAVLGIFLLVGAIVVFPLTACAALVGWLIDGQMGALIGAGIAGIIGLLLLHSS